MYRANRSSSAKLRSMAKIQRRTSELVSAAEALEEQIARLETISRSARKIRLSAAKNISRAAAELEETLALPEQLSQRLQAVAVALGRMQERQQAAIEPLTALALEIRERTRLLAEHMKSFDAVGKAAADVNTELSASRGDRSGLAQAEARLLEIAEAARHIFEAARADDFPEVAREADVLKQRMTALGKRLRPRP